MTIDVVRDTVSEVDIPLSRSSVFITLISSQKMPFPEWLEFISNCSRYGIDMPHPRETPPDGKGTDYINAFGGLDSPVDHDLSQPSD